MRYIFILLLIVIVFDSCNSTKETDIDRQRINRICDNIMMNFKNGKIAEVSSLLKANSSLIGVQAIDTLQKQIIDQIQSGVFSQYGNAISFELVKETTINNFAAKRYYAVRFERYYLTIVLSLYHSIKGWEMTGFKYDQGSSLL